MHGWGDYGSRSAVNDGNAQQKFHSKTWQLPCPMVSGTSASPATRLQVTPDCLMVPAKSMIPSGTTGAITLVVPV